MRGNEEKAIENCQKSLGIIKQKLGENNQSVGYCAKLMGNIY